jgi:predicted transcriptional regulator
MQDDCLAKKRDEITAAIDVGFAEAERGELIDGDEVRTRMVARKSAWMAEKCSK